MPRRTRKYGWKPDFPDQRDQFFTASRNVQQSLPPNYDLTVADPRINFAIYDQGQIGSCTANALAAAVQYDRIKLGLSPDFVPARLFLYYNERVIENSVSNDSGAYLRDGMKTLQQQGICLNPTGPTYRPRRSRKEDRFPLGQNQPPSHRSRLATTQPTIQSKAIRLSSKT